MFTTEETFNLILETSIASNSTVITTANYPPAHTLSRKQMLVISILTVITTSFSIIGSGSILIISTVRKKMCSAEVFPIFQLSLADLLASVMMLTSTAVYLSDISNPLDLGYKRDTCSFISAFTKCFYVNTFLLTTAYACEAYLRMRTRSTRSRVLTNYQTQYFIYVLSWVVPIAVTVVIVAMISSNVKKTGAVMIIPADCTLCLPVFHYNDDLCWANELNGRNWYTTFRLMLVIPLVAVMAVNVVLYVCIFYTYRKSSMSRGLLTFRQRKEESSIRSKAIIYQAVFASCWAFSLILGMISLTKPFFEYDMSYFYWLFVLQAITAPLQGFCNCIIYGWRRRGFKNAISDVRRRSLSYNSISL